MSLPATTLRGSRWGFLDEWIEGGHTLYLKHRRWLLFAFLLVCLIAIGGLLLLVSGPQIAKMRLEDGYHASRKSYRQKLTPGTTRKNAESYLRAKNVLFERAGMSDLTRLGHEDTTWWCGGEDIYLEFRFVPAATVDPAAGPNDTDTLDAVSLYKAQEGCF